MPTLTTRDAAKIFPKDWKSRRSGDAADRTRFDVPAPIAHADDRVAPIGADGPMSGKLVSSAVLRGEPASVAEGQGSHAHA